MAGRDPRDIKGFLEEKNLPKGAVEAVVNYGLETDQDFFCMSEEEFDKLKAKDFEKGRLKQVWRELKSQATPAAAAAAAPLVMQGGQGNIGRVHNAGRIKHVGHNYNQGPVGPGARQQNNYDNARGNVQTDNVGTPASGGAALDEDLRRLLEDKGLMAETVAALEREGVTTRQDLLRMTSEEVDRLPLREQVAEVQRATLKSFLEELRAGSSSIRTVVRNNTLCVGEAKSNTRSGFVHQGEGACAQNVLVENCKISVEKLDESCAVSVSLTADKSGQGRPGSGQGGPAEVQYHSNTLKTKNTGHGNVQRGIDMPVGAGVSVDCRNNTQVMENSGSNNVQTGVHLSGGQGPVDVQSTGNTMKMDNSGGACGNMQIGVCGAVKRRADGDSR